jgi:TRAP-type mannitol/chloroaromatic compound transport system permease small subunit
MLLLKIERVFDAFSDAMGKLLAWLMVLMMLNVFYDVVMRYFFKSGSIAMQELEWHIFSIIILYGVSYALKEDGHVRVDLIYDRLTDQKKAIINIVGVVLFLFPIAALVAFGSIEFALEAFRSGEMSGDPGGLPHRFIIKSMIPLSFFVLMFVAIGYIIKNINIYRGIEKPHQHSVQDDVL